jgi:hypothetical protein
MAAALRILRDPDLADTDFLLDVFLLFAFLVFAISHLTRVALSFVCGAR